MHRAGVRILPGTDVAVALMYPGFSLREELEYFVDNIGMTPMEALVSATRSAAAFSGMQDSRSLPSPFAELARRLAEALDRLVLRKR